MTSARGDLTSMHGVDSRVPSADELKVEDKKTNKKSNIMNMAPNLEEVDEVAVEAEL